jgi:hypothetical protein
VVKPISLLFYPRKETQYPMYRRLDGPQGWSGWIQNTWPPPEFELLTAQPIM